MTGKQQQPHRWRIDHVRKELIAHAEQAAVLAEKFAALLKECPTAISPEAIRTSYRAVDKWAPLLRENAKAAQGAP